MWLSQKIKKDSEAKKTLKEISKLIREYSDATKITKQKFWSMDVGMFFRPRTFAYFIAVLITMAIEVSLFYSAKFELSFFQKLVESSMLISVQILVVGISLSTVVKSLDKESRFATEYLKDTCQIIKFACLTFLTVLNGYFCGLLFKNTGNEIVCVILSSFAIGGTIWCLWSLIYIIVETTKCMYPEFSTKAASTYAARKLIHVFMKKTYLGVWMAKHSELLDAEIKPLTNIRPSHECFTLRWDNESTERKYKIKMAKEVNFHLGYRDYDLNKFEKLDKLLKSNNAKLYLTPNFENNNEWGIVSSKENCDELLKLIKRGKFCKFKKDRHIEAENEFWDEHYLKLYLSLFKTVEAEDVVQFKEYLNSIASIFNAIRNIRKDRLVRKHSESDYEKNRYLLLYSKSIEWLLETDIAEEVFSLFIEELSNSIEKQAESDIKNGDWYVLNVFKWILPKAYKLFKKHEDSSLWKERARIGRFYYYAGNTLSEYSEIEENDKLQIQLTLHIGMVRWLLTAIENKDNELIDDICEAAKKLVLPDEIMKFVPTELVAQHFILCGKYLKLLIAETPDISIEAFKSLLFDKYNRTEQNVVFSELIEFYIESRKNNLRDYLREFEHTDWKMRPLGGGGMGTPHFVFDGGDIDYTFIYLALLSISENEKVISFEFWHYNAKEKIAKFEKIAKVFNFYDFQQRKILLEKWMDDCGDLYKQQEEQKIADAILNPEKVSKYADSFWSGYRETNTFFKFCLKNGYYTTDEAASTKLNYTYPKDVFIGGSGDASGDRDGTEVSRGNGRMLVRGMVESAQESKKEVKDIELALNSTCQWLIEKGTTKTNGIIVYCGKNHIESKMHENKDYIPRWKIKEDVCFHGYYKDYPILVIHNKDVEKCVALNLKGWKGLHIRTDVINDVFGNLTVREWKEDEINKSISDKKIKEEDRNKVRGQCLVEYELFWKLDKNSLPEQMAISMTKETEDENVSNEGDIDNE